MIPVDTIPPTQAVDTALATTIGPLTPAPESKTLTRDDRACLVSWRDDEWNALKQRVGNFRGGTPACCYEWLIYEHWTQIVNTKSLPPRALVLFYMLKRVIPRTTQLVLRRALVKHQGRPIFPAWPFDAAGSVLLKIAMADVLLKADVTAMRFPWFWPQRLSAAAMLTHDVESAAGLAFAETVAEWEEDLGLRSSFNIVGMSYQLDMRKIAALRSRGHEIGSHALFHDRSLFASRASFDAQLPKLKETANLLGATGFRSPATHRVVDWLCDLPFSYDCTMPHSDPYEPMPGGTATVWPFFHRNVVELPYTAPQDHTLFNLLGHRDGRLWKDQLNQVISAHGLFQVVTHPDPEYLGQPFIAAAYRELLTAISQRTDLWCALPNDIASWWRRRAAGKTPPRNGVVSWSGGQIKLAPATVQP